MMIWGKPLVWIGLALLAGGAAATDVVSFRPGAQDFTPIVRQAIAEAKGRAITMVFEPGRYSFKPDFAEEHYAAITNHENGLKRMIFRFVGFDSVEIEAQGAEFIFSGRVLPFRFEDCRKVSLKGLSIDWETPFYFQGRVLEVDSDGHWMDLAPYREGYSWKVRNRQLVFPAIDRRSYSSLGETLAFDRVNRRVAHGAWDYSSNPEWVEERADGVLRLYEPLKHFPKVGEVVVAKGPIEENRYAPAIHAVSSHDVRIDGVTVHHALGMGFLFEHTDTISLVDCGVMVRSDSDRMVSTLADATHFSQCRGSILVQDCRFEHMLDDGTNVHGVYAELEAILDERTVRARLMHPQQEGSFFAGAGDVLWLIQQPSPARSAEVVVRSVDVINERLLTLSFEDSIPAKLAPGDLLENRTWTPSFTMRGCTIKDHRARGIVLKTPRPVLIEDNFFSSMMSAVFLRGESSYWYESGSVEDVLIRNNRFEYCAYSGMEHAVLRISPRLNHIFDQDALYDRNIRFVGNQIRTFDSRLVWAERVDGLVVADNVISQTARPPGLYPGAPLIEVLLCRNVRISGNVYVGASRRAVLADPPSAASLVVADNQGF